MKLNKIYSNHQDIMKPLTFNGGFNIIYGDIEDSEKNIHDKHEHNLGKSSLVNLIDFLLLKEIDKDHIFKRNESNFKDWIFFLEIKLNNGKYLTIRRSVENITRASFKLHIEPFQDFSEESQWEKEDIPLNSKRIENARDILKNYLNFDALQTINYRSFLPFLLRTQGEYTQVFHMPEFKGSDLQWKPVIYEALGFKGNLLKKKYSINKTIETKKDFINELRAKEENTVQYKYKLKATIEVKEKEKKEIADLVDKFNFFKQEESLVNYKLVEEIENKISILNSSHFSLTYSIDQINKSLNSSIEFNTEDIKTIFEESKIYIKQDLFKTYDELIEFNKAITHEISTYLNKELTENKSKLEKVREELQKLNKERSEIMSVLKEKDTFIKYKKYQDMISKIESEILFMKKRLEDMDEITKVEDEIRDLKEEEKEAAELIRTDIDLENPIYEKVKKLFTDIFKSTMGESAVLFVSPNNNGNAEFDTVILNNDILTSQSDGYTTTKVMSAAFVLSILCAYSNNSFFKFAYHDGILESMGNNPKRNFLTKVRELCDNYGIQYIISVIKSEIPDDFEIKDSELSRKLNYDDRLYGMTF